MDMPGGDRSGPRGEGAKTGRAAGYCSGNDSPGYANLAAGYAGAGYGGRGMRGGGGGMRGGMGGMMGGGRGRGYRNIYHATGLPLWMRGGRYPEVRNDTASAVDDIGSLKQEAGFLEERLKSIIERIKDLESDSAKDNG